LNIDRVWSGRTEGLQKKKLQKEKTKNKKQKKNFGGFCATTWFFLPSNFFKKKIDIVLLFLEFKENYLKFNLFVFFFFYD